LYLVPSSGRVSRPNPGCSQCGPLDHSGSSLISRPERPRRLEPSSCSAGLVPFTTATGEVTGPALDLAVHDRALCRGCLSLPYGRGGEVLRGRAYSQELDSPITEAGTTHDTCGCLANLLRAVDGGGGGGGDGGRDIRAVCLPHIAPLHFFSNIFSSSV
jgi:hypothetical protein